MDRDVQKSRMYRCDHATGPYYKGHTLQTTADIEAWVRRIVSKDYFRRNFPGLAGTDILIKSGAGTRIARGGIVRGVIFINAPMWARTEGTMLHELAHVLPLYAQRRKDRCLNGKFDRLGDKWEPHGWQFAHCYLVLVRNELGREAHDALRDAFKAAKVRYNAPREGRRLEGAERDAALARLAANREVQAARNAEKLQVARIRVGELADLVEAYKATDVQYEQRVADLQARGVEWIDQRQDADVRRLRSEMDAIEGQARKMLTDAPTRRVWADTHPHHPQPKRQHGMWQFDLYSTY